MLNCPRCSHHLVRTHRSPLEKMVHQDVFRCHHCHFRLRRPYRGLAVAILFLTSRYSHCLRCGSAHVSRSPKKDRIDTVSNHPFSLLFALTGAPINRCPACRLQFRDWRKPAPEWSAKSRAR